MPRKYKRKTVTVTKNVVCPFCRKEHLVEPWPENSLYVIVKCPKQNKIILRAPASRTKAELQAALDLK